MTTLTVTIDIFKEIAGLTPAQRSDFMQRLACENDVIEHVVSQIVHGCTENGSSGAESNDVDLWTTAYPTPIDNARRFMACMANKATEHRARLTAQCALRQRTYHHERHENQWRKIRELEQRVSALNDDLHRANESATFWREQSDHFRNKVEGNTK